MRTKHARPDGPREASIARDASRLAPAFSTPSTTSEPMPELHLRTRAGSPQELSREPSLCFDTTVSIPSESGAPAPVTNRLPVGTTLQRYVLLERLGAGAMGVVYAAHDYGLDRKVALKLLREPRNSTRPRRRLMREAQALARLSHPNVVAVHDIGSFGDQVFIAMEYVDGRTLRRWCEEDRRSLREILAVFRAAGEGLAAAHDAGIVHRDFKPDNVLVDRHGRARVSDFGLAKVAEEPEEPAAATEATGRRRSSSERSDSEHALTRTGTLFGTPAYMALEQHLCKREIDARADQFSFAVALYEAACGVHPFDAETPVQIADNILHGRIHEPRRRVPGWLVRALLPALAADPDRRYPSMAALLRKLRDRRRWRVSVVVVAVLAAVAVGAVGGVFAARGNALPDPEQRGAEQLDIGTTARVIELRVRNGYFRELLASGQAAEALSGARRLVDDAAALRYPPVHAEALSTLAGLLWAHDEFAAAEDTLFKAVEAAEAGRVPRIAVEALLEGMWIVGEERGRYAEAHRYAQIARGKLAGLGGDDALEALLEDGEGVLWLRQKQLAKARPQLERGLGLYTKVHGPDSHQASASFEHLGALAQAEGRFEDAVELFRRARQIAEDVHGLEHSVTLTYLAEEAKALYQAGRYDAALETNQRGHDLLEEDDKTGVLFLINLGLIEWKRRRHSQARAHLTQALGIIEKLHGRDHVSVAETATDLGLVLEDMGHLPEARARLTRAAAIYERAFGPGHPDLAAVWRHLGRVHAATAKP